MREEFADNPITSKYKLIRHDIFNFEIVDQYEKKFIECKLLGFKGVDFKKGLEFPYYSLKDSANTPMGEITLQRIDNTFSFKIKNSLGETVATVTTSRFFFILGPKYKESHRKLLDIIIKTPTR